MKEKRKSHKLLSLLLCCAVLIGMMPMTAGTAFAAASHPTAVNGLEKGGEMCLFWGNDSSIVQYILKDYSASGSSAEEKWNNFKAKYPLGTSQKVNSADGKNQIVKGLAYYDPASGTLYLLGQIGSDCDFEATTDCSDVLTVIVDGDTTLRRGWCGKDHKGLGKMNIEFRNNATLNIPERGKDMFLYPKAAALDITWTKETSRANSNPDVKEYGDLELRGTGKLNIVSTIKHSYSEMKYGIQARNITIKDNVSLNIVLQRGTSFSSGILSHSLKIDTTGTVNIDVSDPRDGDENVTALRSIGVATDAGNYGFNLVNAQSVTLKTKKEAWVLGNGKTGHRDATGIYNSICKSLADNDWTVTKDSSDTEPYTVTMTRTAKLEDLKLNVGGTDYAKDVTIPDHVVSDDDASKKLSVSFHAGPQWFSNYYLKNKVNLNARVNIWRDGVLQNGFNIAQMTGGRTDGKLDFTLDVQNLNLEADHTYSVHASIYPTMNGTGLADKPLAAQWTFKTVATPVKEKITAVKLKQSAIFGSDTSNLPTISVADDSAKYEMSGTPTWTEVSDNTEQYTAEVTLKIKDAYNTSHEFASGVAATIPDYDTEVESVAKNSDGTLKVTLKATKHYKVTYATTTTTLGTEYAKKGDEIVLPDKKTDGSTGFVFEGWKKDGDSDPAKVYQSGDTYTVTGETTFKETWSTTTTETRPRIFVMTFDESFDEEGHRSYDFTGFSLTVERQEYGDSNSYNSVPVAIRNLGNEGSGQLTVSVVESDDVAKQVSVGYGGATTTTVEPIESGRFGTFEITVSRVTGAHDPEPFKAGKVRIKVEDTENSITKYFLVTINVAPGPYSVLTSAGNATTNGRIDSITVPADVENKDNVAPGSVVTVTAPAVAGYAFARWKALSPDGTAISEVTFDDANAATTTFVMPSKNVSVVATYNVDTLNSIFIASPPNKTVYNIGETLDVTGMTVMAEYDSGSIFTLESANYDVSPANGTVLHSATTMEVKVTYKSNDGTPDETKTATTNITVLPADPTTYQVTYDANGGSGTMAAEAATQNVPFTLPNCAFTPPSGKTFDKWQVGSDTSAYQPGQQVGITGNTTVKAIWTNIPSGATQVDLPAVTDSHTYDGTSKTGVTAAPNSTLSGTHKATNAGTYTAIASLNDPTHYWKDGTQMPKVIEWTISPADRSDKQDAPEMESRTADSITLKAITAPTGETVEYSMNGSYWQSSTTFTGLSAGTDYTFYARYAAKQNYKPSPASDGATFTTLTASTGGSSKPTVQKPEITIIGSGKADLSADGRTAAISADEGSELVSITLNGKEVAKTDKLTGLKTGDKVVITFRKTGDDSAAITKSIASKVSQMQLIARSSKTAKKNIKVVLKTDAKTAALIKDIQDLGYTVKYKFYRSTKKSASYQAMLTKDETKYLNTIGKKGIMYYYKARLMVYDKSGKLVAKSELKQCKYANRLWTK